MPVSLRTAPGWRKDVPLVQGEEILLDLGRLYNDDDLNQDFLCTSDFLSRGGHAAPGPILLTSYRIIHMELFVEVKKTTKSGFFGTRGPEMILHGCSLHVAIPFGHIERVQLGDTGPNAVLPQAYGDVVVHVVSDYREKYSQLYVAPADGRRWSAEFRAAPRGQGEIVFRLEDDKQPSASIRAKRVVDEANRILAEYVSGAVIRCKYCSTKLKPDMSVCSYCGAPAK
jgi:hypothetical protein